ncbi:DUF6351 family protein [Solirubrobacter phytolaccae]|uniref:DUF6351 family protein n=1 Tax=Solirubrobacter phytolaccae TaxID=1404360 RepID=A0A9X3NBF7_9ACTN|nr:DUF6351 family protein [Solirubrobacter phytolaccae]MDA0179652.1 DUF6351 family protein [Solirubrobacter phytolaccae]
MVVRVSAVAVMLVLGGASAAHASGVHSLEVLSNRADLISGGDALVAASVTGPVTADLDGADVTSAFAVRPSGRLEGLVTGLKVGENVLTVRDASGAGKRITITNHPIGGPIFAGPQVTPYACNPNASTPPLGAATDAQCNAPTRVELLYRNAANQFVAYDPADPPADVQPTTTDRGRTVPFVVQRVTGTVDRGIFQLAVLVDPAKPISPWSADQPWSRKLLYTFGGACGTEHRQLAPAGVLGQVQALGTGFAVATSSLNIYANNCNDVVSAEAAMMTKELVVERYGPLRYTIGTGGSAATMQQHLLAENYPGLLDGLMTSQAFEDHFTQVQGSLDCRVLMHYFWPTSPLSNPGHAAAPPNALFPTAASRQPVWGSNPTNPDNLCGQKVLAFGADRTELVPTGNVACGLQPAQVWHPVSNPTGERCGIADFMRAIFGVTVTPDAPNGKGKLAVDNVGVQYGLVALQRGQITPAQFVDLNAKVGGMDIDGNFIAQRTVADPDAVRIAYETGRINSATGAARLPEIDNRTGAQMDDTGFHPAFHSFTYRARLDRSNGDHANQVIWLSRTGGTVPNQFDAMRQWLDTGVKPTRDACFMAGGVQGDLSCNGTWTAYGNPRLAAGVPYTLDIVKCRLKPLARADYGVSFTDEQWAALQAAFPDGVCDHAKPGVSQQPPKARWLTFEDGPGGRALGAAPSASEFVSGTVGGTVPATLALSLAPASFGTFVPGVERDYTATTKATVTSTAGDAALSVSDPGYLTNGAFTLPEPLRVELAKTTWTAPTANEDVAVTFRQRIKPTDPLRTGSYSRTVTVTLTTVTP